MVNSQQVDAKHPAYTKFINEWQMIDDCVAGERAIKERKERYLPRPNENEDGDNERYTKYLNRASFINATGRTLSGLIGIAFNKLPKIELKGALKIFEDDADGEEQPLSQFIRDCLTQTLKRGRAGIFVDYTSGGEQTELTKGRAVLRLFNAKQIINWRVTQGRTSLVVLKYEEPANTDDFTITMITKFIELRLIENKANVKHWTMDSDKGFKVSEFVELKDHKGKVLSEIPFVWIGSNNNDHTPDIPPLSDIAYTNVKHYQLEADLAESAHIVGSPMVAITGLTEIWADKYLKSGFVVGSRDGVMLPVGGDLKFVQPEDRNLVIQALERKENQMAMLGAKLVERNSSARTATQASDEAQTDNSILSLCAGNVESAINKALIFAQLFEGSGEGVVELNKRYDIVNLDSQAITALMATVQSGKMRLIDFIRYQQRIGLVPQNDNPEDIIEELETSNQILME